MKKRIPAVILMFSLFLTGAFAANTYQKSINVEYGITLSINGQTPRLTDVNGKTVQPFVYDGTTYVPIRAVGENLGVGVTYNSSSNTAILDDTKEAEKYLYFLANASNAASLVYGDSLQYQALKLGSIHLTSRFYPTTSNVVQNAQNLIANISIDSPYYSDASNVNVLLSQMLDAFADLEDAYYNNQSDTYNNCIDIISDNYKEVTTIMVKSATLTY